jgi:hypothetical protein
MGPGLRRGDQLMSDERFLHKLESGKPSDGWPQRLPPVQAIGGFWENPLHFEPGCKDW